MKKVIIDFTGCHQRAGVMSHGGGISTALVYRKALSYFSKQNVVALACRIPAEEDDFFQRQVLEEGVELRTIESNDNMPSEALHGCGVFYSGLPYDLKRFDVGDVRVFLHIHGLRAVELPVDSNAIYYASGCIEKYKAVVKCILRDFLRSYHARSHQKYLARWSNADFIVPTLHTKYAMRRLNPSLVGSRVNVAGSLSQFKASNSEAGVPGERRFLMVAAGRWEKNARIVLKAFLELKRAGMLSGVKLCMLGVPSDHYLRKYEGGGVDMHAFVTTAELEEYYRSSYCLIYPSKSEGYGYPPLEAMSYGCPSIVSMTTSIPEVCGAACLYFNPYDISELQNRMLQIDEEGALRGELVKRSLERVVRVEKQVLDEWESIFEKWYNICQGAEPILS